MANGASPKRFSERSLQTWRNIQAMRQQGAPDEDIEEYLDSIGAERVNDRGAIENVGRGLALGTVEAGTSLAGVGGFLTRPIGGRRLEEWAEEKARQAQRTYDPLGMAGTIGRGVGRVAGEAVQAVAMAPAGAKLLATAAPRVGKAATAALGSQSRLQRALGTAALSAPVDVVQGLKSEEGVVLPGRLGSIAENVLLSTGAGALTRTPPKPIQQPLGTRRPQPPGETVIDTRLATVEPRPTPEMPMGGPAGVPLLEPPRPPALPGAPRRLTAGAVEAPAPAAAAATITGEAPNYPISYYSDWIFGSKKNPISPDEKIVLPEGTVRGIGMPGKDWMGGYDHFWLTVEKRQGKRLVKSQVNVRPVITEDGLRLERVIPDGPKSTGTGQFIDTPRPAPIPDEKQLARWRKQEERMDRRALDEEEPVFPPAAPVATTAKVADQEAGTYRTLRRYAIADIVGAKTGQPFRSMMLRGEGGSAVQGTGEAAILGKARYTTPDETYAREFAQDASGKMVGKVSPYEVNLNNPLVIDSDSQWRALTKRAGWFSPNPTGMPQDELTKQISALRRIVEADGHDGIIVRIPREYRGQGDAIQMGAVDERYGKTLDRVFGADQVIEFAPQAGMQARPGFAQMQALTTLGGAGIGATLGGLTGTDRETRIGGAVAGAAIGAGLGAYAGRGLVPPAPAARGSTPDIQEVNQTIRVGDRPASRTSWLSGLERFRTNWIAQTFPMEKAGREAFGEEGERMVVEQIAKAQGAGQAAKQYILDNVSPTLEAARGKWDDVRALLKARRDLDIRLKGGAEKSDVPTDVLERAIRSAEADPEVKAAADAINGVYRDLLYRRYQAGIISSDTYNRVLESEDFYTPFVREFVDDLQAGVKGASGRRWTVSSSGIRRMDREAIASAQTADPLEVLMASVERTFNDVGRQNVQNVLATFADLGQISNLIRPVGAKPTPGVPTFTQMRGGRPVQYEVLEKELYDAIAGQSPRSVGLMYMLANFFKRGLQRGVTILPDFAIANVIRDLSLSGIQRPDTQRAVREMIAGAAAGGTAGAASAEEGERLKGFLRGAGMGVAAGAYARPLAQTMAAMRNIVREDEVYKNFLRQGGSTEGFYVRNASEARDFLKDMERNGTIKDIINPRRWYDALMYVGSVTEMSTRLAAYKQLRDAGKTEAAAILGAQDRTLRFAQRGKQAASIADVTAFWNPRVQGWDKLAQMLKDPKTWGLGASMLTAPSIALWNVNKDNPEYWERPVWERNLFWLVPKGGEPDEYGKQGFWRIPKPFEIGMIFASLPERLLDAASQSGVPIPLLDTGETAAPRVAEPGRAIGETLGTVVQETAMGLAPIPTGIAIPGQMLLGQDIFRGRPIVSRPDLPAEQQVTPESSALARALATRGISPQQTDFAVRATLGGAGSAASRAVDVVTRQLGGAAPEPRAPRKGAGVVIPSRFQTRTYSATDTEVAARERLRDLEKVHRGMLKEEASNDIDRIRRYEKRNEADLRSWYALSGAQNILDDLAQERREIIANQRIPQDQRTRRLAEIRQEADQLARQVLSYGMRR
jgi:hypothetical protein